MSKNNIILKSVVILCGKIFYLHTGFFVIQLHKLNKSLRGGVKVPTGGEHEDASPRALIDWR